MKQIAQILISGFLLFYGFATFNVEVWKTVYFIWDKGKDVLFAFVLLRVTKNKYGNYFKPLFILLLIRFIWEPVSKFTGLNVNNNIWVGCFFITVSIYALYTTIKNVRN